MAKLWDKGYSIDTGVEQFTVADDWKLDRDLVTADAASSIAHAEMLASIGIITPGEREALVEGLKEVIARSLAGEFPLTREHEDCHTAIESVLIETCGEAGKKIHTGRSRNDQVQTALRIWMRSFLIVGLESLGDLVTVLANFADAHKDTPMPGRTHMQIAMPSSVGLWAAAYAEELEDMAGQLLSVLSLVDQSPLGSAASYGVPLPLDREKTASLLGFSKVQNNVLYANNSRGKFETIITDSLDYVCLTLSKIAQDLILYSMPEFGYFSLPKELTTGSSIMPQKKNPDVLELVRSRSAQVTGASVQIKSIIRSLPSGYNRDFQDTKGPFMKAAHSFYHCIGVMRLCFEKLQVVPEALKKGFIPEIYATDKAIEAVLSGKSFRDAYRTVGTDLEAVEAGDPAASLKSRSSTGTTGNLNLDAVRALRVSHAEAAAEIRERVDTAVASLIGGAMDFFRIPD